MTPSPEPTRRIQFPRGLILALFALMVCIRMPEILFKGRFWAEEGRNFFHAAWVLPPLQALFNPYGGYLNIVANASTLAARWIMPLALAPYLTIAIALLFQLLPPLLLLTARDTWLHSQRVRFAGILLLLLAPGSEEIWLQTLHCQFELTLCCAMVLAMEAPTGRAAAGRLAILLLAPLCGPGAIVLAPLFLVRAAIDRTPARLTQATALLAGSAIQLLLFFHTFPERGYALNPLVLLWIVTIRHLAVPFLGLSQAAAVIAGMRLQLAAGRLPILITVLPILVFVPFGWAMLRQRATYPAFWLLASGMLVGIAGYYGAIGGSIMLIDVHSGERYVYVPQVLFSLAALILAATATGWTARIAWVAVVWLILIGAVEFEQPWKMASDGPSWRAEVAAWHHDPTHVLRLWPDGWTMTLEPRSSIAACSCSHHPALTLPPCPVPSQRCSLMRPTGS